MKIVYWQVTAEIGFTDVLDFDDYEKALEAAEKWHKECGLAIDIVKVTEELVKKVGE